MKKKLILFIPLIFIFISLILLFRPMGRITLDKSVSENRILFKYEIFGCGSVIGKVLDGGEEITESFIEQYPNIGLNEVAFTEESDEPRKHMDSGDFFCGGLAERYTYVIEGKAVGVTRGAPECCDPKPAYNENVVEFKVDKWYFTSYVPYFAHGNIEVILIAISVLLLSCGWVLLLGIWNLYKMVKNKVSKHKRK